MRAAIPICDGRISPVFDAARRLLLVDIENGREIWRTEQIMDEPEPTFRARRIVEFGANILICGAISRPLEATLVSAGVEVIPQTCGQVEEVLRAFMAGQLTEQAFLMPGSCGHRRRRSHGGSPMQNNPQVDIMKGGDNNATW
ncbi:MAG: NifB/NifX family molybdenum-iron cluster-binding protein [Pirellulales bacterium]|nr:NifB/NifX family molybdenum-iron cluster-binding protein [Pirellulales bacterium]